MNQPESALWIEREDEVARADRIQRLDWVAGIGTSSSLWGFHGGLLSKYLFEEARYCYVYGQYLASIMLGLSFIERMLGSLFYASGRNDLQRANITTLLEEALAHGMISQEQFEQMDHARNIRNDVTHFRPPLHENGIEARSLEQECLPYDVIQQDAEHVLLLVFQLLDSHSLP